MHASPDSLQPSFSDCPLAAAARRDPEGMALRQDGEALSFRQLDAAVSQAAARLRAAGCNDGMYVALLMPNDRRMVVCLLALVRLGAIACPLNTRNPPQVLGGQMHQLNCRRLIAAPGAAPAEPGIDVLDPDALCAGPCAAEPARTPASDRPAVALFTSGSTAAPKAALLTLGNLVANARASNAVHRLHTDDCWLLSLPLFHVGGIGILFRCLEAGASFAIGRKEEPLQEALGRYRVSYLSLVPTQLQRLLNERPGPATRARLKCILLGGAAAPDALVREALRAGLPVRKTYGLTEMASQVATVQPTAPADKQTSAGRVLPGCEVKVAPDGELLVRGPSRFTGYVEAGSLILPFDADGWFATGDLGQMDQDGYLIIRGRKDNLFVTGGENVQPEEIEAALCAIEGVEKAVVVPVEDFEFGFRPIAFVKMAAGQPDEQDLSRLLQSLLPRYKIPVRFFSWPNTSPGPSLKTPRADFRELARTLLTPSSL